MKTAVSNRHNIINRRRFIKSIGNGFLGLSCTQRLRARAHNPKKPNYILIQMDDLGWSDIGVHGNRLVDTPVIDKLAGQSVRFNQFYVNPVCAPSRAALLTGRDFLRTGVSHVHGAKDFMHLQEKTIADVLGAAGYATGMWGKWHSGHTDGYFPWERGFDQAYQATLYKHRNSYGQLNGQSVKHNKWADQIIVDYAIDFIKTHRHQPFFCYLSSLTCHRPLDAPSPLIEKYNGRGLSDKLATLYAMIENFDTQLYRLLDLMEQTGLHKSTVILFMSDNGPAINNSVFSDADRKQRNISNLKGHKGNIWENGVKSPLFIRWSGHFNSGIVDHLCDITDIFPTLVDLADIPIPVDPPLDGISLRPVLTSRPPVRKWPKVSYNYANPGWPPSKKPWTAEGVHDEYRPVEPEQKALLKCEQQILSIRQGRYKLLLNPGTLPQQVKLIKGYALFDILNDPHEENNLIKRKPQVAEKLKNELELWFAGIKAANHSFSMPIFLIGQNGKRESKVMAKGPQSIGKNLHNAFNYLCGWQRRGDFAYYRLRVLTPGHYRIMLYHDSTQASQGGLAVSVGEQSRKVLVDDNQCLNCGDFNLSAGDCSLRIKVIADAPDPEQMVMDKLNIILFKRLNR